MSKKATETETETIGIYLQDADEDGVCIIMAMDREGPTARGMTIAGAISLRAYLDDAISAVLARDKFDAWERDYQRDMKRRTTKTSTTKRK